MPVTPTFPGVYIEEIPSGVRTITGVATSITAFIGRTLRGPVNEPTLVNSFADFDRTFGGLDASSPMTYAVRDFYNNGGSQALIIRLYHPFFASDADRQTALTAATTQAQTAANAVRTAAANAAGQGGATPDSVATAAEGAVAAAGAPGPAALAAATAVARAARAAVAGAASPNDVASAAQAAVAGAVTAAAAAAAPLGRAQLTVGGLSLEAANDGAWGNQLRARVDYDTRPLANGQPDDTLFNLSVKDMATGTVEVIRNVSVLADHPRRVDRVLQQESNLVRTLGTLPTSRPTASSAISPGQDPFSNATSTGVTSGVSADSQALANGDYAPTNTASKQGIYALDKADLFNLFCIPPDLRNGTTDPSVYQAAMTYCVGRRAMLIVDSPAAWSANAAGAAAAARSGLSALGLTGTDARNAALYFPRVKEADPLRSGQVDTFVPSGIVAGVFARTDVTRGVWKAPAGLDATLNGVVGLDVNLTDAENGTLNPLGINCLRSFPVAGQVVWGARTLRGADQFADEYKYVPVRRLALFLEESLYRGTQWVVFEPNDEPLWAQIRLNIGAFMQNLFRQGAFQGRTPREAYLVKVDSETTTQNDINLGIVNIIVGFAPLKPAEFVIIKIQQLAGQIQV